MLTVRGSDPRSPPKAGPAATSLGARYTKKKRPPEFPRAAALRLIHSQLLMPRRGYVATRPGVLPSVRAPGARPTPAAPDVGARRLRSPCLIRFASHRDRDDAVLWFALPDQGAAGPPASADEAQLPPCGTEAARSQSQHQLQGDAGTAPRHPAEPIRRHPQRCSISAEATPRPRERHDGHITRSCDLASIACCHGAIGWPNLWHALNEARTLAGTGPGRSRHSSCLPREHGSAHLGTVHEPPAGGRLTRADMWRATRARSARTDSPFSDRRRLTADWLRLHVRPARGAARRIGHTFRIPLSGHSITGVFSSRRSMAHAAEFGRLARHCRSARSARDCYERGFAGGRCRSRARARSRTLRRLRRWHSSPTSTRRQLALYRVQGTPRAR